MRWRDGRLRQADALLRSLPPQRSPKDRLASAGMTGHCALRMSISLSRLMSSSSSRCAWSTSRCHTAGCGPRVMPSGATSGHCTRSPTCFRSAQTRRCRLTSSTGSAMGSSRGFCRLSGTGHLRTSKSTGFSSSAGERLELTTGFPFAGRSSPASMAGALPWLSRPPVSGRADARCPAHGHGRPRGAFARASPTTSGSGRLPRREPSGNARATGRRNIAQTRPSSANHGQASLSAYRSTTPLADGASRSPGGRHHGRAPSVETPNLTCGASPTDQPAPQVTPLSGTPHDDWRIGDIPQQTPRGRIDGPDQFRALLGYQGHTDAACVFVS